MNQVIVWNSDELVRKLVAIGVDAVDMAEHRKEAIQQLGTAGLAILVAGSLADRDGVEQRLQWVSSSGCIAGIVLPEVSHTDFLHFMLMKSVVAFILERDVAFSGDVLVSEVKGLLHHSLDVMEGHAVGSLWPLPSDPEAYEQQRILTFNTPSMARFLVDLRSALAQMRRDRPSLPWDPDDRVADPAGPDSRLTSPLGRRWVLRHLGHSGVRAHMDAVLVGPTKEWATLPPPLLLTGESGTGKTLISQVLHDVLTNREDPTRSRFAAVTGAGLDVRNFDHVMHGATEGAWTDVSVVVGHFARAAWGTLFFDELGDMPLDTQTRLLTFFNDLTVDPIGGRRFFSFSNVVAATNRDVETMVGIGSFRHDLLARFRLRVRVPALRERTVDERRRLIDFVAQDPSVNPLLPGRAGKSMSRPVSHIASDAMSRLLDHEFADGNFRELEQVLHTGMWKCRRRGRSTLRLDDLELRPPRFRQEAQRLVFQGHHAPDGSVQLVSVDELRRLAEHTGAVIIDTDGSLSLQYLGTRYSAG